MTPRLNDSYRATRRNHLRFNGALHAKKYPANFDSVKQSLRRLAVQLHIKKHGIKDPKTLQVFFPLAKPVTGPGRFSIGSIHRAIAKAILDTKFRQKRGRYVGPFKCRPAH